MIGIFPLAVVAVITILICYKFTKNIIASVLLFAVALMACCFIIIRPGVFNVNYATQAYVKYHMEGVKIDCEITDKSDIEELKRILKNSFSNIEAPSSTDPELIYIKFVGNGKSVKLAPHRGYGTILRIDASDRHVYVSKKDKGSFLEILNKYGMPFDR